MNGRQHDVVIVGGGQAGLAIGRLLARAGRRFTILEAADAPAAAWRARWDSLKLFTPVRYDSLPGRAFPGDPDAYPGRDDVVAYLTDYARDFELPVELDSTVRGVRLGEGGFVVELDDRTYEAGHVVVATGPFQVPRVPAIAERLAPETVQFHSSAYRTPGNVPDGPVLVVGGGNTGYQIADELSRTHEVHLSIGARQTPLPQRIAGRDLFRYLQATGLMGRTADSRIGQRMRARETLIGSSPRAARRHGIRIHGRTVAVAGRRGHLRRRHPPATGHRRLGDRLRTRPLVDRRARSSTPPAICGTTAASRRCPGCTSWACRGSTRAAPRCWGGSRTTPSTSPTGSARPHQRSGTPRRCSPGARGHERRQAPGGPPRASPLDIRHHCLIF